MSVAAFAMLIGLVAVAAWLVAAVSAFQAWRIAERHPPYRALGFSRYLNWMGSLKHMPAEAGPHLRRFYLGFAVFFAAILGGVLGSILAARS